MRSLAAILLATLLSLTPLLALAAPFIVSDAYVAPAVIPDYFKVSLDGGAVTQSPAYQEPGTQRWILHFDVGSVSVGSHTLAVSACKAATMWGPEACSSSVNFPFARPAAVVAPAAPTGIALASQ